MTKMSLLRKAFRNVFAVSKRKCTRGAAEVCDPGHEIPNPGPGWVGSNLPFQIDNLPRLFCVYVLFFASGLGLPFFMFRQMTLKAAK